MKKYFVRFIADVYVEAEDRAEAWDTVIENTEWGFDEVETLEARYIEEFNEEE